MSYFLKKPSKNLLLGLSNKENNFDFVLVNDSTFGGIILVMDLWFAGPTYGYLKIMPQPVKTYYWKTWW